MTTAIDGDFLSLNKFEPFPKLIDCTLTRRMRISGLMEQALGKTGQIGL
jgi:hypothetical protein